MPAISSGVGAPRTASMPLYMPSMTALMASKSQERWPTSQFTPESTQSPRGSLGTADHLLPVVAGAVAGGGLALFVAENLTHMNVEETDNQAALWSAYTDEELIGIERALIASLKPEELMVGMRWMLVGMTPAERSAKLAGIRMGAPAPAFEAILGLARAHLSQKDWRKLSQALALPEPMAA